MMSDLESNLYKFGRGRQMDFDTVFDNDRTLFIIIFFFFFATPPSNHLAMHQAATTTSHGLLSYYIS